jgi:hypothetical protein
MRPLLLSLLVASVGCTHATNHACDPGTHVAPDGNCESDVVCGAGTTAHQGVCLPNTPPPVTCGPGTHADGSQCLPDKPGGGLTCGTGTHAVNGACVPDSTISCGMGTHLADSVCLPDNTTSCGAGTHLVNDVCLPDETCGAGTHDDGHGACVPIPGSVYEVRVSVTQVGADGYSAIPVFVIGTNADGTPASDTVLLTTSIPGEGTLAPSTVKLTSVGNTATPRSTSRSTKAPPAIRSRRPASPAFPSTATAAAATRSPAASRSKT